jgi:flagellar biosynthesis protein FlhF
MNVRKFIVSSLNEGKRIISKEMGEDAVIISTRSFSNPELGGKESLEITASVDHTPDDVSAVIPERKFKSKIQDYSEQSSQNSHYPESGSSSYAGVMSTKIDEIYDLLKYKYSGSLGDKFGELYKSIIKAGFSEEYSLEVTGKLSSLYFNSSLSELKLLAVDLLLKDIKFSQPFQKTDKRNVFVFVGPTGSGKTTTLAKLAIISKLIYSANTLLISADTHKVGGSDQLQTFASIAGLPFRSAYNANDISKIVAEEQDRDFIFIDTTGRSHKSSEHMSELNDYIKASDCNHLYLVISATASKNNLNETIKQFSKLNPGSIVVTKIDELSMCGELLESLRKYFFPLSYFSVGQEIPEDIEPASAELIGNLIKSEMMA